MRKLLRNRTVIGIICIVTAFFMCFVLTPLFNRSVEAKTEVVRITQAVKKGDMITQKMIETVTVGSHNIADGVIKDRDSVIGKYAVTDISKGDYVFEDKLSIIPITNNEYLLNLDGTKQVISITLKSFASGLSAKLESGDIITIIAVNHGAEKSTIIPEELKYVQVLAVTAGSGSDTEASIKGKIQDQDDKENELPVTVTLLVDEIQARLLAEMEFNSIIHIALVYRGERKSTEEFLVKQDEYIWEKYYKENVENQDGEDSSHEDTLNNKSNILDISKNDDKEAGSEEDNTITRGGNSIAE